MEEKINVDIVKYFVLIALIGLWSISYAISGYSSEHYLSIFIFFVISISLLYLRKLFIRKCIIFLGIIFILILLDTDTYGANRYFIYPSILITIYLLHTDKFPYKMNRIINIYSNLFFSSCYKYALMRHDILNILTLPSFTSYDVRLRDKFINHDVQIDIKDELLLIINNLGLKNKVISYSQLEISSEKEFVTGTLLFILLALAKNSQKIYIEETGIVILHPNKSNSIQEYQKFLRYSVNGSIDYQGDCVKITFY